MTQETSYIKGKRILAVDDEEDILETIEDILDEARVDRAADYAHRFGENPKPTL